MDEFVTTALAVVWSRGPWRCVYCKGTSDDAWVVLDYGGEIAVKGACSLKILDGAL